MKRLLLTICALLAGSTLTAAELELSPPRGEWLLQPVGPPLLQREGTALVSETEPLQELVFLVSRNQYEEALAYARETFTGIIELVEAGDADRELRTRVVAGGFMPNVQRNQVSATLMYLLGHVYMQLEQYEQAEVAFLSALRPIPDYVRVHESLGLLYMQTEDFDAARDHLSRAAALGLNTANLYGALGYLNQESNNFWGAISAYQQAMVMEPANRQWQQGLLFALAQTYQFQSGLTLVDQMLQQDPDDAALWMYRSQMSLQADEREQALTSLETALRMGESTLGNLQVAATLHMEFGSIERAVDLLEQGLQQDMPYAFVDQALGWLLRKGEWEHAERLLADVQGEALVSDARSQYLMRQASISLNKGDQTNARNALEGAIELDPNNAEALMLLAGVHQESRNYNQAELYYQRASANDLYRENAYISMAQLAIDQDDLERALRLLQEVVERNPGRSDLARNIDSLQNLVLLRQ